MDCLPDEILRHRIQLLEEEIVERRSEVWRIREELQRRKETDPQVTAFLDAKQAREISTAGLGAIV